MESTIYPLSCLTKTTSWNERSLRANLGGQVIAVIKRGRRRAGLPDLPADWFSSADSADHDLIVVCPQFFVRSGLVNRGAFARWMGKHAI